VIHWHLEVLPIKELKPHPKNPRQMTRDKARHLENDISEFGLIEKPIVNKDWQIIGGHQRINILKKKKAKNVECWVPDILLNEKQIDKLCISLNLHQGQWDYDILANEWEPLDLLEWGFTEEQLLGSCKEADEVLGEDKEENNSNKKKKNCPNCGHEF
jgi:ParB-like chromosome segregation protein Spo0J